MEDFYKGKRVLVTGADGFMGSHLTEKLLELGAEVSVWIRGTSYIGTNQTWLRNINGSRDKIKEILTGDISNSDSIGLMIKNKPEIIFHLAAIAYVPFSFDHPIEVMQSNLIGTLNVLEAARKLENERTVCTSSSEVYGPALTEKINEDHPLNPTSPYAASKAAADRTAYSYIETYNLPIAIIRPFNTYGPRMLYDVTPKFIKFALNNEPLTIHGSGKQSRDLSYVTDTVSGFLTMGSHKKASGEVVNFGTGKDISIKELAEKIIKISGSKSKIIYIKERLAEVSKLCCDNGKAKRLFNWEPKVGIDEGLKLNIEWMRNFLK